MNPRQRGRRRDSDDPGPVLADPGPGSSTDLPAGKFDGMPGQVPLAGDQVLIDDDELELIRWAGYDAAIADATARRDQVVADAAARLDKATRAAYAEYGQTVDAAAETFELARRAAMNAHELAGQAAP